MSAISVPVRSRWQRVSSSGMSSTTMETPRSRVSTRHCSITSA